MRAQVLEQLERSAANADKRRDLVIREIERRRATRAFHFREAADIVDADAEEVGGKSGIQNRSLTIQAANNGDGTTESS